MPAPTAKQRRASKQRDAHAWKRNAARFHTCAECEANFRLVNGQLPVHNFLEKPCPGSGAAAPKTAEQRYQDAITGADQRATEKLIKGLKAT